MRSDWRTQVQEKTRNDPATTHDAPACPMPWRRSSIAIDCQTQNNPPGMWISSTKEVIILASSLAAQQGLADLSFEYLRRAAEESYRPIGEAYKAGTFNNLRKDPCSRLIADVASGFHALTTPRAVALGLISVLDVVQPSDRTRHVLHGDIAESRYEALGDGRSR